ncbi:serine/threonine-protein kinase [Laspinema olomoucense]|uniref:serine/threonine-protein kinase n=1 Tax=Laspinema olomoucense TaxID=3231600 RepID=UPI0021BABD36|nr:serine/threonine-protein kinase [Laspinema sp. D3d]MCT7975774.1 serine/threonine protein kinase [Laspinema sp. D3d]
MKPLFCSKGHDNFPGSRFCQSCGEPLKVLGAEGISIGAISAGTIVGDRYRLVRELGHGGFGRTYLAEDINRFNERCVLKEFAPKVQGTYAQQKAEELFAREAGVLYQLQHRQIPKFRELCRSPVEGRSRLFLVQDYVEGPNYRVLLSQRRQQGQQFTVGEVTQLLQQLLPVLDYIHSRGVIHRDISPDNLIFRNLDQLPVLIDFGGVKQVAAQVESQVISLPVTSPPMPVATRLGKVGYAPEEQMMLGQVYPHSDLYALGVTVLVLLTGEEPQPFFDPQDLNWGKDGLGEMPPGLQQVLKKMLARRVGDRFQSATQVLQAIAEVQSTGTLGPRSQPPAPPPLPHSSLPGTVFPTQLPPESISIPKNVNSGSLSPFPASVGEITGTGAVTGIPQSRLGRLPWWGTLLLVVMLVVGAGSAGWWGGRQWVKYNPMQPTGSGEKPDLFEDVDPDLVEFSSRYSPEEFKRKAALRDRREELGISYEFYVNLVNEVFYERYPSQRGIVLSYDPVDELWRSRWDELAAELLDYLGTLSDQARRGLGSYDHQQRDQVSRAVNQLQLSSRALYDLADAQFFSHFPEQQGVEFINQPVGQIWQAIVSDQLTALQQGKTLQTIEFSPGQFRHQVTGTLASGEGKAYTAYLFAGQILRLSLQANPNLRISLYPPTRTSDPLLEDSSDQSWSGVLPESGYYEIIVISNATEPLSYHLKLATDRVTSE